MEAQTSTEFILGPMFSGKTTRMLESIQKERMGGVDCLVVKHAKDSRYTSGAAIQTHNQRLFTTETGEEATAPGSQRIVMAEDLLSLEVASNEAVVGVDEGQFFGDLRAAILQWQNEGRRVIVSALDGDYGRQMFAPIIEALPLATAIVKLSAVCTECALRKKKTRGCSVYPTMRPVRGKNPHRRARCIQSGLFGLLPGRPPGRPPGVRRVKARRRSFFRQRAARPRIELN